MDNHYTTEYIELSPEELTRYWYKNNNSFIFDLSDLRGLGQEISPVERIFITNLKSDRTVEFERTGIDTDGEDVGGWRYEGSGLRLLIIND